MISKSTRFENEFVTVELVPADYVSARHTSKTVDQFIAGGLLSAMVFTTLAHGAVEPWSVASFGLISVALLLAWGIKATLDRRLEVTIPPATAPIGVLLLLGIVQSGAFTVGTGERVSLSIDVEATRHAVMTLFFLAASFVVAANYFNTRQRLVLLANFLTIFGAVVAVFALIQHFTWDGRFYWLRATEYTVFGPFVNRAHFAGYMAMLIPIPLGLMLRVIRGQARLVYGFAAALMGTAAIISGSRSGMISLIAAMATVAILNKESRRSHRMYGAWQSRRFGVLRIGPMALVALAILACVLWLGAAGIVERFGQAVDALLQSGTPDVSRATIWRETLKMVRDYPIAGIGLGGYSTVYPSYAETQELLGLDYAHNDYLQIFANCGILGVASLAWFAIAIWSAVHHGVRSHNPLFSAVALAAAGAIVAVAVQSLSDTNLQIPSNALLFLVLSAAVSRIPTLNKEIG